VSTHPFLDSLPDAGLGSAGKLIGAEVHIADLDLRAPGLAIGSAPREITEFSIDQSQDALYGALREVLGPLFILAAPLVALPFPLSFAVLPR
jgi:hypothetical protein